ncbi:MAG: hypothetical protein JO348_08115 [Alphaproteobacteria bacterium]|nr:hypothetical protein [Alphaproteobacteria bacterium]
MSDDSGAGSALGVIVGAILVVVVVFGGFLIAGRGVAPSGPSINITAPVGK